MKAGSRHLISSERAPIVPCMRIPDGLEEFARTLSLPRSRTSLFFYDAGSRDSPPVLLVHGLGDEADTWRRVIRPLSKRFRVIAPDLPGFGRSLLPARRRLSPPFIADLLLELIEALGASSAIAVGSSLGASLAQLAALRGPGRFSRLILVDGGLLAKSKLHPALLLMLVPMLGERGYRSLRHAPEAAYASLSPYYARLGGLPAEEREFLRERVRERVESDTQMRAYFSFFRGYFAWMLLNAPAWAARARRTSIETLYVWGAEDHIIPLDAGQGAAVSHPGARLAVIPAAGHLPHQEAPDDFLRLLS